MNRQIISIQVDHALLSAFEEAVNGTPWLESIHGEGKRSERIRRAQRATMRLLSASPQEVETIIIRDVEELKREMDRLPLDALIGELTRIALLLTMLSALRELEKGLHGGDVAEVLALSLRDRVSELELLKDSQQESWRAREGSRATLDTIISVLK